MDSIAAATGWPNSPTRATSEASPPASGAAVVTSTGVPASFMACTSRRVLLRSNPTCSMGPGLLPSRLSALTSSVLRGEAPVFMAFISVGSGQAPLKFGRHHVEPLALLRVGDLVGGQAPPDFGGEF